MYAGPGASRTSTTMKALILLSSLLLVMGQRVYGQLYNVSEDLTPPIGNSPKVVVKTVGAYRVYTCVSGTWKRGKGYATLVDTTTNKVVGNHTSWVDQAGIIETWTLYNSAGDAEESGDSASSVTGRPIASASNGVLLVAVSHQNLGAASAMSYIQMYNTVGGGPPAKEKCNTTYSSVTVPYKTDFCLWSQDSIPTSVPQQLSASPGRLVDGYYGEGVMLYKYNGSSWVNSGNEGKLYNLPGSPVIGYFWAKGKTEFWGIYDPNGFTVYAESRVPKIQVSKNGCPWTLSNVTTKSLTWSFGSCTKVQTTSTRGGLSPTVKYAPAQGAVLKVSFSAIFWFYTS